MCQVREHKHRVDLVKESPVRTCSVASSILVALIPMSSAWAKATRKRPFMLKATCLCLKVETKGSITRLKIVGKSTALGRFLSWCWRALIANYPDEVTVPLSESSSTFPSPLHENPLTVSFMCLCIKIEHMMVARDWVKTIVAFDWTTRPSKISPVRIVEPHISPWIHNGCKSWSL